MRAIQIKYLAFLSFFALSSNAFGLDFFNSDAKECNKLLDSGKDLNIALHYCERAANAGDENIQVKMGEINYNKQNYAEAKRWFEKAENKHNATALYYIGTLYENGWEMKLDISSANFYYKKSCERGYLKACHRVEALKESTALAKKTKEAQSLERKNQQLSQQQKTSEVQSQVKDVELEKSKLELEKAKAELARLKAEAEKAKEAATKAEAEMKRMKQSATQSASTSTNGANPNESSGQNSAANTPQYTFREGLARFEQDGLWGYVNEAGNMVIPPRFTYAANFYSNRAAVRNTQDKWGFIDKTGRYVVTPQFCMLGRFSEGLAGVYVGGWKNGDACVGGKWGFIDTSGNFVIPAVLDEAQGFSQGKAKVTYNGQVGFIDKSGRWVN